MLLYYIKLRVTLTQAHPELTSFTLTYPKSAWFYVGYLTIIPGVRMGYESIANEAEGRMGYRLRGHEE